MEGILYMKNLGKQMATTAGSVTNRITEIEERLSDGEDTTEKNQIIGQRTQ